MMSELAAEGSGNYADLCPSSENQALPFLTFSISKWFGVFVFNLKHTLTLSPSFWFRGGKTGRIRGVSGFGVVSGEERQKRKVSEETG